MGVDVKTITFVGREFKNEEDALSFFKSKIHMTAQYINEMGPKLIYWLEPRIKKGFPKCGPYSWYRGDENQGFYIGYQFSHSSPKIMQNKIVKASELWKKMFKETPKIVQAIIYS